LAALAILFSGCYGDFGRPRPSYFGDNRAWWLGVEAANSAGLPASAFPLTDHEILMRDLAFNLIAPPYDRARWNAVLFGFFSTGVVPRYEPYGVRTAYGLWLFSNGYPSSTARYAKLADDIRNDSERIDPFVAAASKVLDLDRKREQSLAYVSTLAVEEVANAKARIAENALIVDWVRWCLTERAAAYRFALERLVIATPSPKAVDAERALVELDARIARFDAVPVVAPVGAAVRGKAVVTK
jgi:hypothetical protein